MRDLRDTVTAFVLTTGEPSTSQCAARLRAQTIAVRVETIAGVVPMDRAFQAMLDRCETPFYVQVDADMLLEPDAIERLYDAIVAAPAEVAEHVGWLWGDAEERPIQGVKIYRHAATVRFPYAASLSCEVPQVRALEAAGWKVTADPLPADRAGCLGTHWSLQTPRMAFRRWRRLMHKHRAYPWMGWLAPYPAKLRARWLDTRSAIDEAAYLGAVSGLTGPLPPDDEVDASAPDPDYRRVASYVGEYSAGPTQTTLYLTDRCNFRCNFCLREHGGVPHDGEASAALLGAMLDRFPTIRGVCLAGFGEPLLSPHLSEILALCKARGVYAGLITNGMLLAEHVGMLAAHPPAYVSVSLNAIDADEHHAVTQARRWDRVLDGVRVARAAGLRAGVSFVVTRQNVGRVPAMIALGAQLDAAFVHLVNLLPHAGTDSLAFRDQVIQRGTPEADALLAARTLPGAERVEVWPTPVDLRGTNPGGCLSPFVALNVDGAGFVSACRRVTPPTHEHGHFTRPGVWHDTHASRLRLEILGDQPKRPECRGCFAQWQEGAL